jgi:hypothetical protein
VQKNPWKALFEAAKADRDRRAFEIQAIKTAEMERIAMEARLNAEEKDDGKSISNWEANRKAYEEQRLKANEAEKAREAAWETWSKANEERRLNALEEEKARRIAKEEAFLKDLRERRDRKNTEIKILLEQEDLFEKWMNITVDFLDTPEIFIKFLEDILKDFEAVVQSNTELKLLKEMKAEDAFRLCLNFYLKERRVRIEKSLQEQQDEIQKLRAQNELQVRLEKSIKEKQQQRKETRMTKKTQEELKEEAKRKTAEEARLKEEEKKANDEKQGWPSCTIQ